MNSEEICAEFSTLVEKITKEAPEGTTVLCSIILPIENDDERDLAFGCLIGDEDNLETAIMLLMEKNSEIFGQAFQKFAIKRMSAHLVPINDKTIFGGNHENHGD